MIDTRKLKKITSPGVLLVFMICLWHCSPSPPPPTGWPVDPTNQEHEIGNSAEEFQQYSSSPDPAPYFHDGLDILISPPHPDAASPSLRAVRDGYLSFSRGTDVKNHSLILKVGDILYTYGHVDENATQACMGANFSMDGTPVFVTANKEIGKVVEWPICANNREFHHIHFRITDSTGSVYFNPLLFLQPRNDTTAPRVKLIRFFKQEDPTIEFYADPPTDPIQVNGSVDIVANIEDTIFSTLHNTGIYYFSYTIGQEAGDHDTIFSYSFDKIPPKQKVSEMYRVNECSSDYCFLEDYEYIVTNVVNGKINGNGAWNTLALDEQGFRKFPDGNYKVTVTATDMSGNSDSMEVKVKVKNENI
ncbi:MAG: hypothetical protein JSV88_02410 [Candidatus Aminicenantes bacterium]|nr:MAG: hypothetical protein JSV88_02410 [Candidatus Aminicenantes bacterium]